jgi:V8-like Glu-specific endopeptidase
LEIKENVIYHNLKTWVGHSGSAIIGCDINEQPAVIGVHTHKGLRKNSGVYLSNEAINKLIAYEINFALAHE